MSQKCQTRKSASGEPAHAISSAGPRLPASTYWIILRWLAN